MISLATAACRTTRKNTDPPAEQQPSQSQTSAKEGTDKGVIGNITEGITDIASSAIDSAKSIVGLDSAKYKWDGTSRIQSFSHVAFGYQDQPSDKPLIIIDSQKTYDQFLSSGALIRESPIEVSENIDWTQEFYLVIYDQSWQNGGSIQIQQIRDAKEFTLQVVRLRFAESCEFHYTRTKQTFHMIRLVKQELFGGRKALDQKPIAFKEKTIENCPRPRAQFERFGKEKQISFKQSFRVDETSSLSKTNTTVRVVKNIWGDWLLFKKDFCRLKCDSYELPEGFPVSKIVVAIVDDMPSAERWFEYPYQMQVERVFEHRGKLLIDLKKQVDKCSKPSHKNRQILLIEIDVKNLKNKELQLDKHNIILPSPFIPIDFKKCSS